MSIKDAAFVSTWEDGTIIQTPCSVNLDTKEVYNVAFIEPPGSTCDMLEREFVLVDGVEYDVFPAWELGDEDDEFWFWC